VSPRKRKRKEYRAPILIQAWTGKTPDRHHNCAKEGKKGRNDQRSDCSSRDQRNTEVRLQVAWRNEGRGGRQASPSPKDLVRKKGEGENTPTTTEGKRSAICNPSLPSPPTPSKKKKRKPRPSHSSRGRKSCNKGRKGNKEKIDVSISCTQS